MYTYKCGEGQQEQSGTVPIIITVRGNFSKTIITVSHFCPFLRAATDQDTRGLTGMTNFERRR